MRSLILAIVLMFFASVAYGQCANGVCKAAPVQKVVKKSVLVLKNGQPVRSVEKSVQKAVRWRPFRRWRNR